MELSLLQLTIAALVTAGIVYSVIPLLIKVAYYKDLYDKPDGERKLHDRYISSLGGVAIFIGLFIGYALSGYADHLTGFGYLSAALVMLFFTGLKDDLIGLSPNKKLAVELATGLLIIFGCNAMIGNFHGVFGAGEVPLYLSIPVTLFTVIVIMNAYNLIDGIDGLAGGIGMIASLFLAVGFYSAGQMPLMILALFTSVALLGFLLHNFHPANIFMGDTGSLVVGFLLAFLTVKYIGLSEIRDFSMIYSDASAILPVAFLAIPLYDTLTVFMKRLARGDGPFTPGRDHVHHQLLEIGFSQRQTAVMLYLVTILIGLLAISISHLNNNIVLGVIILSMVTFLPTTGYKRAFFKKTGLIDIERYFTYKERKTEREAHRSAERIQKKHQEPEQVS
ncbi:MraY family glycosyltransferase [Rhodohalobacter halophilus]|uniref:MraY family glycosyltransferase n=1 Tax=Rhodohalobacter halophilus TaxID=1812810 RepID=UPI00083F949D|nr:MraY family glycosyltransferase [Rhodohalobacter halophilus]